MKSAVIPVIVCMTAYMLIEYYLIDIRKIGSVSTAGNSSSLLLYLVEIWGLIFVVSDARIRENFKKHIVRITLIMSFIIYVQYILYYVLGIALSRSFFVPFSWLYESSVTDTLSNASLVINGLFRPSACFLEPSHFAAYSVLALGIMLFEGEELLNKRRIFVTVAIVLSTSGLGIAASLFLWGMRGYRSISTLNRKKVVNTLIICMVALLAIVVLYFTVDFFSKSINRVLIGDNENAITGRLWTSIFVDQLTGNNKYWGVGFRNRPISDYSNSVYYMTGIIEMLYCQGLIGTLLLSLTMAVGVFRMWKYGNILNFSVMVLLIAWFILGNIVTPYYLVKYFIFTFYEDSANSSAKVKEQSRLNPKSGVVKC